MDSYKVGRLEIRVKGVPPEVARSAVAGLGSEVLSRLSERPAPSKERVTRRVGRIDLGTLEAARDAGSADLRREIAARVAGSIEP